MEFRAYDELYDLPSIVVDGRAHKESVLVLSHWRNSGTAKELIRDTSTEIVLDFLEHNELPKNVEYVSNDHFDEDGLIGIFAILNPEYALSKKSLLIDIAQAGDFQKYNNRQAARIVFTINALLKEESGFISKDCFKMTYPKMAAEFYRRLLEVLKDIIEKTEDYKKYWIDEDNFLTLSENLLRDNLVTIKELEDNSKKTDLAIVTMPNPDILIHEMAIHNKTRRTQIVFHRGSYFNFKYRYETWVQFKSYSYPLRVNLSSLAEELNSNEKNQTTWDYEGSSKITPSLKPSSESSIPFEDFLNMLKTELNNSEVDWNPNE